MTTLITITRQSPNTTNNNYLSHSKIFGCKKGILVVSFHSAPFSLSLSLPLELIVVTTPLSLKTKLIIIDKFLNYKYNQIFPLLFYKFFLFSCFSCFSFNHQSIESNQLTNQSVNRQKEKSISNYLLLLYLLFSLLFLQPLTKIYSRWILQSYNFY